MSVNVIQLFRSTLPDAVVRQLSNCLGLPPEATAKVMDVSLPALVAGLLHKSATLDGARSLFATILGQEVNADIHEQLPRVLASTTGVTQLSSTGRELMEHVLERRIDGLSDAVSMQTGVPAHATHAVTGIAGSILMGVLKRHLLDHQGNIGQLPVLLGQQVPNISPYLNDGLTTVLGLGGASAFSTNIGAQIRAVSAHFEHPTAAPAPARGPAEPTMSLGASSAAAAAPSVVREVRHAGPKAKHWFGAIIVSALVGAIAALLTWIALGFCPSAANFLGRNAADAATPASSAAASSDSTAIIDYNTAASEAAARPASDAQAASLTGASGATGKVQNDAAPAAKNSQLIVSVDKNGTPSITATVKTIAEKSALLNALTKKFGAGKFNADITADDNAKPAAWLEHIDAMLPLMQTPGAELKIDGTHIELSGAAADARNGWLDRLKALFGASYQVSTFDISRAVASATESFRNAAKSLLAEGADCSTPALVKALNLQVVNFASRDAHVPDSAFDDLTQSAKLLKSCAKEGHAPKLEVAGYSDSVGGDPANLELSKERADAVRAYLVKAGVPADALVARGYGNVRPVADNATESGRFANRRIEFSEAKAQ